MKIGRVENKFNHGDDILCNGKKIIINDNDELLFIMDDKGTLNLWINSIKVHNNVLKKVQSTLKEWINNVKMIVNNLNETSPIISINEKKILFR